MPPNAPLVIGKRSGESVRGVIRKVALGVGVFLLATALAYTAFRQWTLIRPLSDDGPALPDRVQVGLATGGAPVLRLGRSSLERHDGMWQIHLRGDPRTLGHAHGLLTGRLSVRFDRAMADLLGERFGPRGTHWVADNLRRWRYHSIVDRIPPRHLVEMSMFAGTMVDLRDLPEQPFHRLVYSHALHDLTIEMDHSPFLGCLAFAIWGRQTADGTMLVGRTFDFEGGRWFDRQKALVVIHADGRIPLVSVAWPAMMGVVTGVNARRLLVALNGARTDDATATGIPVTLLAREVLERAGTIDEAIKVIKEHRVMSPAVMLIADGKAQNAVVVEVSPYKTAVRRSAAGILAATNHFVDTKFRADASNDWNKRYTPSATRYKRLRQLLTRFAGRMDARTAAMVMRTRTGVDDVPLGLGNRNALDPLTATHGVVVDLRDMVMWISRGPHLLGKLEPLDLAALLADKPTASQGLPEPIAADPLLGSARLKRYDLARAQVRHARWLARRHHLATARDYAARAAALEPESTEAQKLLGDLLWRAGKTAEARKHYEAFLKLTPPFLQDVEEVKARLGQ